MNWIRTIIIFNCIQKNEIEQYQKELHEFVKKWFYIGFQMNIDRWKSCKLLYKHFKLPEE